MHRFVVRNLVSLEAILLIAQTIYLAHFHSLQARPVADDIGSKTNYTRRVLNQLNDEDEVDKRWLGKIVGTRINGDWKVIDSREQAMFIIGVYGDDEPDEMGSMTLSELRRYIQTNVAESTAVIGRKVWFKRD